MSKEPRILLWDVETSFMTVRTFQLFKDITSPSSIIKDWHLLCVCYKWLGDDKVYSLSKTLPDNDRELCINMREVLIQADIIIHHNGDKFDVKKFNSRLIFHGLEPIPPLVTVDTLKHIRRVATFSSHRLDYLGQQLGFGGKLDNPTNLWNAATDGDEKALKQMVKYCKRDVQLLEQVYLRLRPYFKGHPNLNVIQETVDTCPTCQSSSLHKRGYSITRTGKYQRYQCNDCGSWSQGKKNLFTKGEIR